MKINIRKIVHIAHCLLLYVIILFLSLIALTHVGLPSFCYDDELGEKCLFSADPKLVILQEDVDAVNEKLEMAFPDNVTVYVTFDNKRIKIIYLGDFFSSPSDDDINKVKEIIHNWLNNLTGKQEDNHYAESVQ